MPKVKKGRKIKKQKNDENGIFNYNEQVDTKKRKTTKTAQKKKNNTKKGISDEYFIGTKDIPPVDKKKLEKIKKKKLQEKRTKEKELNKIQKKQKKLRKKREKKNKLSQLTEKQLRRNKQIKMLLKFCILIAVLLGIVIYLMLSPIFNIKTVQVVGNKQITSEQIISLSKIEKEMNLFKVSNKDVITNIKENPYVKKVEIKRVLPSGIKIIITERESNFMLEHGSSYAYIDNQGYILEISATPKEGLAKIVGYTTGEDKIVPGNRLEKEDLNKLNTVLKIMSEAKNNGLDKIITTINIEDENNYSLYLESEQKTVYLGDNTMLDTKMPYVKVILEKEKEHAGEIFVNMDLNEKNPFFREKM